MRKVVAIALIALAAALTGCSADATSDTTSETPAMVAEDVWVRTTTGSKMPKMTGAFMDLSNPSDSDVKLVAAECADAGKVEIHEMAKGDDGKMVMQEAEGGVVIEAGKHQHLKPGGYHVMLMMLKKELKAGDEVAITLKFDNDTTLDVKAPVKEFTEETEHYHPGESASPSASASSES